MKLFSFILAITLGISANAQPTSAEIVKEINRFRASQGLTAASINPNHNNAAQLQADWIAQTGNYSHVQTRPLPGKPLLKNPWDRGDQVGASVVAENLFLVPISDGAAEIVAGWTESPGHRKNLLYQVGDLPELECRVGVGIATLKSDPTQIIVVMVIGDNVDRATGQIRQ
jgi:uncharacterized protein YkwD